MKSDTKILKVCQSVKKASRALGLITAKQKNKALGFMARDLLVQRSFLIRENKKDIKMALSQGLSSALVDRLVLNDKRIQSMADCLCDTQRLKDPVGEVLSVFRRPNGLKIEKVRVPIGVVGIIFESRPNVTSDCLGLCLKSGNAAILKGGKEAFFSNRAIFNILLRSMAKAKIPQDAFYLISSTDRASLKTLLQMNNYVDVVIPRGGEGLIQFVAKNSSVPVIKHYKGVCHVYVSACADLSMAEEICFNAKVQRPGVCNAMETMLVDQKIAKRFLPSMIKRLQSSGVKIRGCSQTKEIFSSQVALATEQDWYEEYLDLILSVKVVKNVNEAIEHINAYGSGHSDAIVTEDQDQGRLFLEAVDSACVYVNASTRFTDGYEFGFGAEIGISTDSFHARGPMALSELTTYKYRIYGKGQVRQ